MKPPVTGAALTTSVTDVVWTSEPLVPPIVTVYVPAGVELDVAMVRLEVQLGPVTEGGLKVALAPLGRPDALSETDPLKPLVGVTVTVYAGVFPPAVTLCEFGLADSEKSGVGPPGAANAAAPFGVPRPVGPS